MGVVLVIIHVCPGCWQDCLSCSAFSLFCDLQHAAFIISSRETHLKRAHTCSSDIMRRDCYICPSGPFIRGWMNGCHGVSWPRGLVHRICVLMAESSECEFESWLRPWCLCPWARHFTIIASLHQGENGYLWGQSWLLCLISPVRRNGSSWAVYSPGSWDGFRNDLWAWWAGVIIHC